MKTKSPAYRFRDGKLIVSDDIEWPNCSHQYGRHGGGYICDRDAENGYVSEFSAGLAFACKQHTFNGSQDYWPLTPESEHG